MYFSTYQVLFYFLQNFRLKWFCSGGMGGPGWEGEGQLLNSIVVEALACVCESEPEIEFNLDF